MKTYRYGRYASVLGEEYYVIQKKYWFGWITIHEFSNRSTMIDVVNQLKLNGHIVYGMHG